LAFGLSLLALVSLCSMVVCLLVGVLGSWCSVVGSVIGSWCLSVGSVLGSWLSARRLVLGSWLSVWWLLLDRGFLRGEWLPACWYIC